MAKKVNLIIDQGTDFSVIVELTNDFGDPLDVTNYTARSQLRKHFASNSAVDFTCNLTVGELRLSLNAAQTANMEAWRYVYDVELVDTVANSVSRVIEGFATVTPEATKS